MSLANSLALIWTENFIVGLLVLFDVALYLDTLMIRP